MSFFSHNYVKNLTEPCHNDIILLVDVVFFENYAHIFSTLLENHLIHHQTARCFKPIKPALPPGFDSDELHEVITAAVCSLDMAGGSLASKPLLGTVVGAIMAKDSPQDPNPDDYLDDLMIFVKFCDKVPTILFPMRM
jgi:hypothetical protein